MKKMSIIMSMIICLSLVVTYKQLTAEAREVETIIDMKVGKVLKDVAASKIVLIGTYQNKGIYAEKIRIEIRDIETQKTILTINPKTNEGYKPSIILANFKDENDDATEQIFLGMDSGGSGGYGYFYVFDVESGKSEIVFDYEKWNKSFTANYENNYKVKISEEGKPKNQSFTIDITNRSKDYLNEIYNSNGTLKSTPTKGDVSAINYIFPYYNSSQGKFQLQVFQRITGIYNADGLGNVVTFFDIYKENNEENITYVQIFENA